MQTIDTFSIRYGSRPVSAACAVCGAPTRWSAGPRLCVGEDGSGVACRECGLRHAPQLAALTEGLEEYPGERDDLLAKRERCLGILATLASLHHGDPSSLTYLRAVGALVDALPADLVTRAVEAAWRSSPGAANKVRVMPKTSERGRRD